MSDLDRVFRDSYGRLAAILARRVGLELAEECVQHAFAEAVRAWPIAGVPDKPEAWLLRAARNHAIDTIRRGRSAPMPEQLPAEPPPESEIVDDELEMMFLCCAPALSRPDRAALTLQAVCGFSAAEIARAFRQPESAVAQRLVRAKKRVTATDFRAEGARLESVLDVLYLLFNEGYTPRDGEETLRAELTRQAIGTMRVVVSHPRHGRPEARALLGLMLLQASRLPARLRDGELVPLAEQDRSLWDGAMIAEAMTHLDAAAHGDALSDYHLLAGIALCHVAARTDWERVLGFYDELVRRGGDALVALNRAVALCEVQGPAAALAAVETLAIEPYLLAAARIRARGGAGAVIGGAALVRAAFRRRMGMRILAIAGAAIVGLVAGFAAARGSGRSADARRDDVRAPAAPPIANVESVAAPTAPAPSRLRAIAEEAALDEERKWRAYEADLARIEVAVAEIEALATASAWERVCDLAERLLAEMPSYAFALLDPAPLERRAKVLRVRLNHLLSQAQLALLRARKPEDDVEAAVCYDKELRLLNKMREMTRLLEEFKLHPSPPAEMRGRDARAPRVQTAPGDDIPWRTEAKQKIASMRLTLDFSNAPASSIIDYLREFTGLNIVLRGALGATPVTLKLTDVTLEGALTHLSDAIGAQWEVDCFGIVVIAPR